MTEVGWLWIPRFEAKIVEVIGGPWPTVVIEKWEENELGERRFVESLIYAPIPERMDEQL